MARRNDAPSHCGVPAVRLITAPMIAPLFEPYKAVGTDGRLVRSRREHTDMLREFGKVEVGNDPSYYPAETDAEREQREVDTFNDVRHIERVPQEILNVD